MIYVLMEWYQFNGGQKQLIKDFRSEVEHEKNYRILVWNDKNKVSVVFKRSGARVHAQSFSECSSTQERKVR